MDALAKKQTTEITWVRESRFGRWFQTTNTWFQYVLSEAVVDFTQLLNNRLSGKLKVLDAGCHRGLAFELLEHHFQPKIIIGIDIDREQIPLALEVAKRCQCHVKCENGTVYNLDLPDMSIDVIFSHQLLHHLSDQPRALEEFYRVLMPGGILLIGESCRSFIHSLPVRLLFRHPENVQKSANEYIELVKSHGFTIHDEDIKTSRPWWSRGDYGLSELLRLSQKKREPTQVMMIARKPELNE